MRSAPRLICWMAFASLAEISLSVGCTVFIVLEMPLAPSLATQRRGVRGTARQPLDVQKLDNRLVELHHDQEDQRKRSAAVRRWIGLRKTSPHGICVDRGRRYVRIRHQCSRVTAPDIFPLALSWNEAFLGLLFGNLRKPTRRTGPEDGHGIRINRVAGCQPMPASRRRIPAAPAPASPASRAAPRV